MQNIDWSILKRSLTGDLTDGERRNLAIWLKDSRENRRYYREMEDFFTRQPGESVDILSNLKRFERVTYGKKKRVIFNVLKYAAGLILLVGFVVLWQQQTDQVVDEGCLIVAIEPGSDRAVLYTGTGKAIQLESQGRKDVFVTDSFSIRQDSNMLNYTDPRMRKVMIEETHVIRVPRGGEFSMKLCDGTIVYLNSATDLKYPVQFHGKERRVSLSGEAYFHVAKSDKPFIVEVNGMEVKVLGTCFNVYAYQDENRCETTLENGSVEIRTGGEIVVLVPGEQAVLGKDGELVKRVVDVQHYTAWKNGQFVFDDERLEDVMNTVERWYDIQVFYMNSGVKDVRINGNISRYKDFSKLLEKIEKLNIAHFEIKGKTIMVVDN